MTCKHCGAAFEENKQFCTVCGAPLDAEETVEVVEESASVADAPAEEAAPAEETVAAEATEAPADPEEFDDDLDTPERKRRKWPIVLVAVIVLLGLLGGGVWAFFPKISRAIMGPAKYYVATETATVKALAAATQGAKADKVGVDGAMTLKTNGITGMDEMLSKFSIKVKGGVDATAKKGKLSATIAYDNEDLIEAVAEMVEGKMGVSFPGLADGKQLVQAFDVFAYTDRAQALKAMIGLTDKELEQMLEEYITDCIETPLVQCETINGKLELDGKNYDSTTFHIDEAAAKAAVNALADKLENDARLVTILTTYTAYANELTAQVGEVAGVEATEPMTEADAKEQLKAYADALRAQEISEGTVDYTVAYDNRGAIVTRRMAADGKDMLVCNTYQKDGKQFIEIIGDDYSIANSMTVGTDTVGELNVTVQGKTLATATYDLRAAIIGGVPTSVGNFKLNIDDPESNDEVVISLSTAKGEDDRLEMTLDVDATLEDERVGLTLQGGFALTDQPDLGEVTVKDKSDLTDADMEAMTEKLGERLMKTPLASMLMGAMIDDSMPTDDDLAGLYGDVEISDEDLAGLYGDEDLAGLGGDLEIDYEDLMTMPDVA